MHQCIHVLSQCLTSYLRDFLYVSLLRLLLLDLLFLRLSLLRLLLCILRYIRYLVSFCLCNSLRVKLLLFFREDFVLELIFRELLLLVLLLLRFLRLRRRLELRLLLRYFCRLGLRRLGPLR